VHRWVKLGILEVSREEARKGKAIKYYKTTSQVFLVPFALTPSENLNILLSRMSSPLHELFHRELTKVMLEMSLDWVVKISGSKDKDGRQEVMFTLKRVDEVEAEEPQFDMKKPAILSSYGIMDSQGP
jgi:hypothetical protein